MKFSVIALFLTLYVWIRHPLLIMYFVRRTGRMPNAIYPRTVNEKFLWRKLFDHDPRFIILSDKLACKAWVSERVPGLAIAKVEWVGTSAREIPKALHGMSGVIKANHGCGTNLFLQEGDFSADAIADEVDPWLNYDHGADHGEWAYSCVDRKLFWEEEIKPETGTLTEVKFFTYGERIARIIHIGGRFGEMRANAWEFSKDGVLVLSDEIANIAPQDRAMPLPETIEDAIAMARKLGSEFDHLRVDLLFDGATWWLGELTVYNQAGYMYVASASDCESKISNAWDIRYSHFLKDEKKAGLMGGYASWLRQRLSSGVK